ncbi:MAG: putative LPS assembly protein LptD [Bacteroidota bacterium]
MTFRAVLALFAVFFGAANLSAQDTVVMNSNDFESQVIYSARDSIFCDYKKQQIHLFGDAHLNYTDVDMRADYLLIDLGNKEVYASYTLDSLGRRVGSPIFVQGTDTVKTATLRYNFETEKAYIQEVSIKQDEFYLTMERGKRQANEEIHFVNGKFTTCNLAEPHYHFFLSRAILVPDKRIVTGPMNLWIMGVPTPLGLPFSVIPQRKERDKKHGFLMPQFTAVSPYGFGLQNLGYYIPINDKLQTTIYGTLYSRGSFGLKTNTEYAARYKFRGYFEAGYQFFRTGFPDSIKLSNIELHWNHQQDPKANPKWSFNTDINFNSNSTNKQTLNPQNPQYFNNTLNSDINLGRTFIGTPLSMRLKASMRQNSSSGLISLNSPDFNFTATRFYPFKRKKAAVGKVRSYESIGMTYFLDATNRANFQDRFLSNGDFDSIGQTFMNGAKHSTTIQWTLNVLRNTVRFTPSVTYSQKYNFQSIEKTFDPVNQVVVVDSLNRGVFSQQLTTSGSLSTNLYSYYRFIGKRNTLLRHVMTPSVTFSYIPAIQGGVGSYVNTVTNTQTFYSQHERSVYSEGYTKDVGRLDFTVVNSFELKQRSDEDTLTGYKKTRIIDNLILSTSYDIFKDSLNWGNLNMGMLINPIDVLNINITGTHSFYAWDDSTGVSNSKYAINEGQGIGRLINFSIATGWTLTSKKSREILQNQQQQMSTTWNPQYQNWLVMPSQIVSFDIPWKISFNHLLSYSINSDQETFQKRKYTPNHTLTLTGDVTITENWKVVATTYLDIKSMNVTNTRLTLYRNIHCWNLLFDWTPIGTNKSFMLTIKGNGQALSNAQLRLQRPPFVL